MTGYAEASHAQHARGDGDWRTCQQQLAGLIHFSEINGQPGKPGHPTEENHETPRARRGDNSGRPRTKIAGQEREQSPAMRGGGSSGRPGGWSRRRLLVTLITLILLAMIAGLAAGLIASLAH